MAFEEFAFLIFLGVIVFIILFFASEAKYSDMREKEKSAIKEARDIPLENTAQSMNTEVTQEDVVHEIHRQQQQNIEARNEYFARIEAAKIAQQERESQMAQAKEAGTRIIRPGIFFLPIIIAIAGAVGDWNSWFYTLFKIIVLIEAMILIGMRLNDGRFRSEKTAIATVYMVIMAGIGIISFMNGGFDKTFWVILDIAYCIMHTVLYLGLAESKPE